LLPAFSNDFERPGEVLDSSLGVWIAAKGELSECIGTVNIEGLLTPASKCVASTHSYSHHVASGNLIFQEQTIAQSDYNGAVQFAVRPPA
jgi:hypothetical protein